MGGRKSKPKTKRNLYSVSLGHAGQRITVQHQLGSPSIGIVTGPVDGGPASPRALGHADVMTRDSGHVAAQEKNVLATCGLAGAGPCQGKERRTPVGGRAGRGRRDRRRASQRRRFRRLGYRASTLKDQGSGSQAFRHIAQVLQHPTHTLGHDRCFLAGTEGYSRGHPSGYKFID